MTDTYFTSEQRARWAGDMARLEVEMEQCGKRVLAVDGYGSRNALKPNGLPAAANPLAEELFALADVAKSMRERLRRLP